MKNFQPLSMSHIVSNTKLNSNFVALRDQQPLAHRMPPNQTPQLVSSFSSLSTSTAISFGDIYDNEFYWKLKADPNSAKAFLYKATFFLEDAHLPLTHEATCRALTKLALHQLRTLNISFFEFVYYEKCKFFVNRVLKEDELAVQIKVSDLDPTDQSKVRGIPSEAEKMEARFELQEYIDFCQMENFDPKLLKCAENFLLCVLSERGLASKKYVKRNIGLLYGPYEKVFGNFMAKSIIKMTVCLEKAEKNRIGYLNISNEKTLFYGATGLDTSIRSYCELHDYSIDEPPLDELRLLFRGVLVEVISERGHMSNILNFYLDDTKEDNTVEESTLKSRLKVELSDGKQEPPENLRIVGDQPCHTNGFTPIINEKLSQIVATDSGRRRSIMMEHASNFHLLSRNTNTLLSSFGIKVDTDLEPPRCTIRELPELFLMTTNGGEVVSLKDESTEVISSYLDLTAMLTNWFLLFTKEFMEEDIETFLEKLMEISAEMRFIIDKPTMMLFDGNWNETFKRVAKISKENDTGEQPFVMFIDDRCENSKQKVKLMQNLYKMKTQCVTFGLVQRNTDKALRGLLLKMHMKLQGLHFTPFLEGMNSNYSLDSGNILAFGYSLRRVENRNNDTEKNFDKSERSLGVIGITANFNELWNDFPPNAHFCEREGDSISVDYLRNCFTKCLQQIFPRPDEQTLPSYLVFLRLGLCPSQLIPVVEKESFALKQSCNDFKEGYSPKIIFLCQLPFKTYVDERGVKYNVQKRTCVIEPLNHLTNYPMFSMAIGTMFAEHLGTFGVLKNESKMDMHAIQNFIYLLCADNQLHTKIRNVPTLVTQSAQVTRAALELFGLLKSMHPELVPYESEGVVDLDRLNSLLDRPS